MATLTFATRPSKLARWQTRHVAATLEQAWPELTCQEVVITTKGDRILNKPLPEIGGKGLFTLELEKELLEGNVDVAVHSLKDLPIESTPGLVIGVLPPRADPRDVLVAPKGYTLDTLPGEAVVGTSSLRRQAQLLAYRPDLVVRPLRGNVDTRLRKVREGRYDAIVLAAAGVLRLGLEPAITQWLPLPLMLPAPGQGALAVQCRLGDEKTLKLLAVLEDPATRKAVTAERAFLAGLGGGCSLPVGAHAVPDAGGVSLQAVVFDPLGKHRIRIQGHGGDPINLGADLARQAKMQGAAEVLRG